MLSKQSLIRIFKFLLSGGSAALVEYLVFIGLHHLLQVDLIIANSLSFMTGFVVSFLLNKLWVFSTKGESKRQLLQYSLLAAVNLLISNGMLWVLVEVVDMPSLVAKIITMVAIATWNYLLFSKIIFRAKN